MGPKLAIPTGYDGYFEILSEDGRAVKCIENVPELARRFPDSVLVRENFKALVSKSDDLNAITGHCHHHNPVRCHTFELGPLFVSTVMPRFFEV